MPEIVERDGDQYVRLDPKDIDFSGAEKAQKLTDVYAIQVKEGTQEVITRLGEHVETVNTAKEGDWIVFNIGNVKPKSIPGYADMSPDEQILARAEKAEAYVPPPGSFEASNTIQSPVGEGFLAKASSDPRIAVTVPFDFVIKAPWGEDQFVKAGGVIINNGETDTYGIDKGAFENTYGTPGASQPFAQTHADHIAANRPLVAEAILPAEIAGFATGASVEHTAPSHRVINWSEVDFSPENSTPVVSGAMKYILPVPDDKGEALVYPETVTDVKGQVHAKGDPITDYKGNPLEGEGVVVYNSSEKIYQAGIGGKEGDARGVIIINHVTEEQAARLDQLVNSLTDNQPEKLTFDQFKQVEQFARTELDLTNMYDSNVKFVKGNMQDPFTGKGGDEVSPVGFKKRDARDRVQAVFVDGPAELHRPDGTPLPIGEEGAVVLKQGDGVRVITKADFEATYRSAEGFQPIAPEAVKPAVISAAAPAIPAGATIAATPETLVQHAPEVSTTEKPAAVKTEEVAIATEKSSTPTQADPETPHAGTKRSDGAADVHHTGHNAGQPAHAPSAETTAPHGASPSTEHAAAPNAPHTGLTRLGAAGGVTGMAAGVNRIATAESTGEQIMGGVEVTVSTAGVVLEAAGKVKGAGVVGAAASVLDGGYTVYKTIDQGLERGDSAGKIALEATDTGLKTAETIGANILTVGMAGGATAVLHERAKDHVKESMALNTKMAQMASGERDFSVRELAADYMEIGKNDAIAGLKALEQTTPVQLVENGYKSVEAVVDTNANYAVLDNLQLSKKPHGNLIAVKDLVSDRMEELGATRNANGALDLTNSQNIEKLGLALGEKKEELKAFVDNNAPSMPRWMQFTDAQAEKRMNYENAQLDLRRVEAALQQQPEYLAEVKNHEQNKAYAAVMSHDGIKESMRNVLPSQSADAPTQAPAATAAAPRQDGSLQV